MYEAKIDIEKLDYFAILALGDSMVVPLWSIVYFLRAHQSSF